jgi:hypothetical protein
MAKKPNAGAVDKAEAEARRMKLGALLAAGTDQERGNQALKALFESEAGQAASIRTVLEQGAFLDAVAAHLGIKAETLPMRWRAIALALAREKFPAPKRRGRPAKITTLADHYADLELKASRNLGGRPGLTDHEVRQIGEQIPKIQKMLNERGRPCTKIAAVTKCIADFREWHGVDLPTGPAQILARLAKLKKRQENP